MANSIKHRHMTLREIAYMIGVDWSSAADRRGFQRMMCERNRLCDGKLLLSKGARNHKKYTTIALLRKYCSEMFDVQTEVAFAVSERFESHEEKIFELGRKIRALGSKMRELAIKHAECGR